MSTYEIRRNDRFNSLEVTFPEKPESSVIDLLKSLKFRWNHVNKLWYGYAKENELTDKINNLIGAEKPSEIATGGVVGDGYMGGGEWTGCNHGKLYGYGEINKAVKAELQKMFPGVGFKTRGDSYSGGQSSHLYIQMTGAELFIGREAAHEVFSRNMHGHTWLNLDDNGACVWGENATDEQREIAFDVMYTRLISKYQHDVHNVKDYMTETAIAIYSKAKSLYSSFIHDETNSQVDYFDRSLYDDYSVCNLDNIAKRKKWEV
jgi:hypothetical protein